MNPGILPAEAASWALQIPIPKDNEPAWAEVEKSRLGDRQKVALRLVAAGVRVRAAATAVGLADHGDVSRNSRRFGFEPPDRQTLGREFRRIAGMAIHELERRLEEESEKIPFNLLQVCMGIATDKIAKAEGWEKPDTGPEDKAAVFLERLKKAGVNRISLDSDAEAEPALEVRPLPEPCGTG